MKSIKTTSTFDKHYKSRIKNQKNLERKFAERVRFFIENTNNPILKVHALTGQFKEYSAFSVAGDLRIIFREDDNFYYFIDIGSHNQVY